MSEFNTIPVALSADRRFTLFYSALCKTGLADTLAAPGPFTVCAPTDDAFRRLSPETLACLMQDTDGRQKKVLLYHILFGMLACRDIKKLNFPKTKLGTTVEISEREGTVTVNDAAIIIPDIRCSNGVIHGVDTVIFPR